jgi:hypothetical protein
MSNKTNIYYFENSISQTNFQLRKILFFFALTFISLGFTSFVSAQSMPDLIFVQIPFSEESTPQTEKNTFNLMDRYIDGARIMLLQSSAKRSVNLTPDFAAACDPDISFDGETILFAGKKNLNDLWQIWQMKKDGSGKKQITNKKGNCISPVHAGSRFYLNDPQPTPQIIYVSDEHGWKDSKTSQPVFSLYSTDMNGEKHYRLTFNLHSDFSPDVLPNGRIIFSSRQNFGERFQPNGILALLAINVDGTDLMPFYGNHERPLLKEMAHVSKFDERVYFIESGKATWLGGGDIAYVSKRRPLHSYQKLNPENNRIYHSPCSLPDGNLFASVRSKDSNSAFSIYSIDSKTGKRKKKIVEDKEWHSIDTQLLLLHQKAKGRSNWLIPEFTTGVFYCMNSYQTNLSELDQIEPGAIKYVRVIEGIPNKNVQLDNQSNFNDKMQILGTAPVEEDGSFHIKVPSEIPITFQLLDKNHLALRKQRAWTWVIGNENRGCIGCHEDRELSPPNKLVNAVLKPAVDLTNSKSGTTIDFRNQIASIISEKCKSCHVSEKKIPNLALNKKNIYQTLVNPIQGREDERYIYPGNAKSSPLIWRLFDKKLTQKQIPYSRKIDKPSHSNLLTENERIKFIEWIDLGAKWDIKP